MKLTELFEQQLDENLLTRVMDFFRSSKKKNAKKNVERRDITKEDRKLISKYFPSNNASITWGGKEDGAFVLPQNVNAKFKKAIINFYNEDGVLKAGGAYHNSEDDVHNLKAIPLFHWVDNVSSEKEMKKLYDTLTK